MKTAFVLALSAALAAGPAFAEVTPAPAVDANGVYQVFRTTDNKLNCEQIISELNVLNAQIKAQQDAAAASQLAAQQAAVAPKGKGGGFGRFMGAAASSGALGALPGVGAFGRNPMAAQAAMAAANAAATGAAQAQANAQMTAAQQQQAAMMAATQQPATASNETQRLGRVRQLMNSKNC